MVQDNSNLKACHHFWRINPPTRENSSAVCKLCGEAREFSNNPQYKNIRKKENKTGARL
jgi:hypothetical protein